MPHSLKLTNGTATLASSILNLPDTFKTPAEIMRAAALVGQIDAPEKVEQTAEWASSNEREIALSEQSRDLLKRAVETHAAKLPPNKFTLSLLTQLGFEA